MASGERQAPVGKFHVKRASNSAGIASGERQAPVGKFHVKRSSNSAGIASGERQAPVGKFHVKRSRAATTARVRRARSEEHTSELQSLMRISYAVFCLTKTHNPNKTHPIVHRQD